ncbi:MAG: hypothetical protein WBL28_08005 [Methylotenera sp.]
MTLTWKATKKAPHVDLQDYVPADKTPAEIKQLREDFYDIYQAAINNNPTDADRAFNVIAQNILQAFHGVPLTKRRMSKLAPEY